MFLKNFQSLVDWRYEWDPSVDPSIVRLSVGLEDAEDLISDMLAALVVADKEKEVENSDWKKMGGNLKSKL
jgi:hypothetical protein